jgi:hypothetical protein
MSVERREENKKLTVRQVFHNNCERRIDFAEAKELHAAWMVQLFHHKNFSLKEYFVVVDIKIDKGFHCYFRFVPFTNSYNAKISLA